MLDNKKLKNIFTPSFNPHRMEGKKLFGAAALGAALLVSGCEWKKDEIFEPAKAFCAQKPTRACVEDVMGKLYLKSQAEKACPSNKFLEEEYGYNDRATGRLVVDERARNNCIVDFMEDEQGNHPVPEQEKAKQFHEAAVQVGYATCDKGTTSWDRMRLVEKMAKDNAAAHPDAFEVPVITNWNCNTSLVGPFTRLKSGSEQDLIQKKAIAACRKNDRDCIAEKIKGHFERSYPQAFLPRGHADKQQLPRGVKEQYDEFYKRYRDEFESLYYKRQQKQRR